MASLPQTSLFAARFRECSARALLLPRRRPGQRTPLWQQRQRAADLLAVASKYPTFPILLETSRECLQDVFDLPALREVLGQLRSRAIRVVSVDTAKASPFAQSLLFNWIAAFMYEGDSPLAERRAAALSLDRDLLRDLLGAEELRELLDPGALADIELELQLLADGRRARIADELHDVLRKRRRSVRRRDRPALRGQDGAAVARRAGARPAGDRRVGRAVRSIHRRRRRGPLSRCARLQRAARAAAGVHRAGATSAGSRWSGATRARTGRSSSTRSRRASASRSSGRWVRSPRWRPRVAWCAASSAARRRVRCASGATSKCCASCAAVRWPRCAARSSRSSKRRMRGSCSAWHGDSRRSARARRCSSRRSGSCRVRRWSPAPLETEVLPARLRSYRPADLDELCTAGELVWVGCRRVGCQRRSHPFVLRRPTAGARARLGESSAAPAGALHDAMRTHLAEHGASFWNGLRAAAPDVTDTELLTALWDLVWAGEVTNDSLAPLRALLELEGATSGTARGGRSRAAPAARSPRRASARRWVPAAGAWSRRCCSPRPSTTEAAHTTALQLLDRYGVVTREAVLAEGVVGGYAAVYGVLKVLGGARPDPARLLRHRARVPRSSACPARSIVCVSCASVPTASCTRPMRRAPVVLAATDPAQPYGAALGVARVARSPGALGRRGGGDRGRACRWSGSTAGRITSSRSPLPPTTPAGPTRWPRW